MKKRLYKIAKSTKTINLWRALKSLKEKGLTVTAKRAYFKILTSRKVSKLRQRSIRRQLEKILKSNENKPIFLSLSFVDWNIPLFQRPQHIAKQLAKLGYLYFYNTRNFYDFVDGYKKIENNLYITNRFENTLNMLTDNQTDREVYIHIYSTNMYEEDDKMIDLALSKGKKIIYEYIDEISEKISGVKIPKFVHERHKRLLEDEENCIVIATATKLYEDVAKHRKTNFKLVTNGVEIEHFTDIPKIIPSEMKDIVAQKRPIIGYYGALASWFDYELVRSTAKLRNDWNFVLIGWDYDGSLAKSGITNLDNIFVIGPVNYERLPVYAQWFDVCTIPFLINEVTNSTSPVKLFEYMALGKPIVTTAMPECKKYRSVIISSNYDEYILAIEKSFNRNNLLELLRIESNENSWKSKAESIIEIIYKAK